MFVNSFYLLHFPDSKTIPALKFVPKFLEFCNSKISTKDTRISFWKAYDTSVFRISILEG